MTKDPEVALEEKENAELRITCDTTKIALQARREARKSLKSTENRNIFEEIK